MIEFVTETPCMASAVRQAARKITLRYDNIMAESGLRITQYSILSEIERSARYRAPTLTELAERLVIERSALGQTLKPLQRDRLIEISRENSDRRRRPVILTDCGRQALERARPFWNTAQRQFLDSFGVDEGANLRATLLQIAKGKMGNGKVTAT
jgi:DNA-binding MarR family transcriptional regulator